MKYLVVTVFSLLAFTACQNAEVEKNEVTESDKGYSKVDSMLLSRAQGVFRSLPEAPSLNSPKAQLGKKLYFETALSANNEMSCNSCHLLDNFGVDNEPTSPGHEGKRGDRNSPSVYNASLHVAQFWDGRAADLVEQAKGPILNPIEMGIPDEATAELKIAKNSEYQALFAEAFPENPSISYQNIAEAIGAFEECLLTPSPFDEYLEGNVEALSEKQKEGLKTFIDAGCITCHMGSTLGGNMYQKFGLLNGPYWEYTSSVKQDRGRAEVTGNDAEEFMFKVPSLRNVEKTHPYFHDGSVKELDEAIRIMAKTQLNKDITEQEVESIVAFLQSLTGEIPANAVATNNEISKDEQV